MTSPRLIYLCNALDEETCSDRGITSDSPAATQKVLQITSALRKSGVRAVVLSLGRGRQQGGGKWNPAKVVRQGRVLIVYAPFFDFPVLTHLISLVGLLPLVWRLGTRGATAILAYNRLPHYLAAMEFARLLGYRRFLDIEDGVVQEGTTPFQRTLARVLTARFNRLCNAGALLATSALGRQYAGQRTLCCYGVAAPWGNSRDWVQKPLVVLLGGTLQHTTGAQLFIEAIEYLRSSGHPEVKDIEFVVTGKGVMAENINVLADMEEFPKVNFLGRVSREEYVRVIARTHVGLALKLATSDLADTTFPSKVIEYAAAGLVVFSTRVSDVPGLFREDGAAYLDNETPQALADRLLWLLANAEQLDKIAARGQSYVSDACSPEKVGNHLKAFFFDQVIDGQGEEI